MTNETMKFLLQLIDQVCHSVEVVAKVVFWHTQPGKSPLPTE